MFVLVDVAAYILARYEEVYTDGRCIPRGGGTTPGAGKLPPPGAAAGPAAGGAARAAAAAAAAAGLAAGLVFCIWSVGNKALRMPGVFSGLRP